jgi:hypothetical protein
MKTSLITLAFIGLAALVLQDAKAGAAVALGPHNQLATSYGGPVEMAKARALEVAHRRYGPNVRILASTDLTGYGAIATARHSNGNLVIGVALGRRSATEADTLAIEQCRKAGGFAPIVRWGFRG